MATRKVAAQAACSLSSAVPLSLRSKAEAKDASSAGRPGVWPPAHAADKDVAIESTFLYTLGVAYLLLGLDLVLATYLDQLATTQLVFHVLAFSVQLFVLFATWITFYVLLSSTFLVKKALYAKVFVRNRALFSACLIHFLLFLLLRLYRLALEFLHCPHDRVWHRPGYSAIYIVQKIAAMVYYVLLANGLHLLVSKPKLYTAECMQT
ncbi:hypothetical protein KFL_006500040 [Klebsormidium nitens]|uniref:Uncharacterized protein n=1 Tax=Klebsormidium nitens TaxID=105231 RepID=A0A1Y1II04_KLENI|nr:hypothetical protein KFL_006500040 [Klebsormidium nitens]|eukprot:GAQ90510.1 hypothetical protein KFL_006500040 [Klebsormidium nitens]